MFTDPHHIVKETWRRHPAMRAMVQDLIAEDSRPDLVVVRLAGQRQVDTWLRGPFADSIAADRSPGG